VSCVIHSRARQPYLRELRRRRPRRAGIGSSPAPRRVRDDGKRAALDQQLSEPPRSRPRPRCDPCAQPARRFEGSGKLRRLCRVHRRDHRIQSGQGGRIDRQNSTTAARGRLGARARHRLFGRAGVEGHARPPRRPATAPAADDRQIRQSQAGDARRRDLRGAAVHHGQGPQLHDVEQTARGDKARRQSGGPGHAVGATISPAAPTGRSRASCAC
jgi:hypothetical protein